MIRLLRMISLAGCLLLTLAFAAAAIFRPNAGPFPSGYRDRSVATICVSSYAGLFQVYFLTHPFTPRTPGAGGFHNAGQDIDFVSVYYSAGAGYARDEYVNNFTNLVEICGHELTVPCWMLSILFAVPSSLLGVSHLRRKRFGKEMCRQCGYDLRAHVAGANCPECGTIVVKQSANAQMPV